MDTQVMLSFSVGLDTNCFQNYLLAFLKIFPIFLTNLPKFLNFFPQNQYIIMVIRLSRIIAILAHNLLMLSFVNRENTHSATVLDLVCGFG